MARQPSIPKQQQSRNQASAVGKSGIGTAPSERTNELTGKKTPMIESGDPNIDYSDLSNEERAELEAAKLNAPDVDDDFDPDAEIDRGGNEEGLIEDNQNEDDDEEVLVRLLHDQGHHHINGHPLESGTVVSMKHGDFRRDQANGVRAEKVEDDYDGEVYDVSEPWKPEQKDEHGNVITSAEIASEEM